MLISSGLTVQFYAAFTYDKIFPREKRLSSIGFCHLIGAGIVPLLGEILLTISDTTNIHIFALHEKPLTITIGVLIVSIINISTFYWNYSVKNRDSQKQQYYDEDDEKERMVKNE